MESLRARRYIEFAERKKQCAGIKGELEKVKEDLVLA